MASLDDVISIVTSHLPTAVNVIIILIVAFIAYKIIKHIIKRAVIARARTKTEKKPLNIRLMRVCLRASRENMRPGILKLVSMKKELNIGKV